MNTNRIAPVAGSTWLWRGIAAAEALLLAVAVAVGLASQAPIGRAPAPASAPAARVSAPAPVVQKGPITCRACRDEVLGADQANLAFLTTNTATGSAARQPWQAAHTPVVSTARQRIAGSRLFRDEVLGADQVSALTHQGALLQ